MLNRPRSCYEQHGKNGRLPPRKAEHRPTEAASRVPSSEESPGSLLQMFVFALHALCLTSVFVLQSSLFCFCTARCILPRGCSKTLSQDKPQPFYSSSHTLQGGCQRGAILLSEHSGHLLASEKPGSLRWLSALGLQGYPFSLHYISCPFQVRLPVTLCVARTMLGIASQIHCPCHQLMCLPHGTVSIAPIKLSGHVAGSPGICVRQDS